MRKRMVAVVYGSVSASVFGVVWVCADALCAAAALVGAGLVGIAMGIMMLDNAE